MECTCKDWKECVPQINNAIVMWAMRSYGSKYKGVPFKLCPWCGRDLTEDAKKDEPNSSISISYNGEQPSDEVIAACLKVIEEHNAARSKKR
jgi:hypothetical protein